MNQSEICLELQQLQRKRAALIRMRVMNENSLIAMIAVANGYSSGASEKDRKAAFEAARKVVKAVREDEAGHPFADVIGVAADGIDAYQSQQRAIEKQMLARVKKLPVAAWAEEINQRGFGLISLAILIGECGDLNLYANPARVWKRMGLAPYTFDGETRMGSTWRYGKEGKLPAEEWTNYGYIPRRRSIAYIFGENLVKQNHGEYRDRYDSVKEASKATHPNWSDKRHHLHSMLVATKRLLRNCWRAWHGQTGTVGLYERKATA